MDGTYAMKNKDTNKEIGKIEQLFNEHYSLLCLTSLGILKDPDIAKDIVQEFFISYWKKNESIIITASFKAYAIKAVKNLSLQYLNKRKKEELLMKNSDTQNYEEQIIFEKPKNNIAQKLLDQLPESRKKIFTAAVIEGLSYSEIAEINNISINTVKTQIKRSYAYLKTQTNKDLLQN